MEDSGFDPDSGTAPATSFDALVERMHAARSAMIHAASRIPSDALDEHFVAPWGVRDSVRGLLIERAMHDGADAAAITEALAHEVESRSRSPEVM